MYAKVLVAYDGSDGSKVAMKRACTLAHVYGVSSITMAWVRSPLPHHALSLAQDEAEQDAADEFFEGLKRDASGMAKEQGLTVEGVALYGDAAHEIVNYAEKKHFDLIVCGQTGHSDIISRMLGQTADRICETAKCDVLIVHRSNGA